MKSTRYLHTQTSVYKASRMETSVSTVLHVADDAEEGKPRAAAAASGGATAVEAGGGGGGGGGEAGGGVKNRGGGAVQCHSSLDLTSNGSSSRSVSKTVSETSSFYSNNNLQE